ncbi:MULTISPECIES: ATP-binding protein [Streptomyces]|uniref:ATP-binding protein n=1 Tax=Streptomyces edwardsiae TaxID=3075527 RepID=A0ABU2Q372_9ACTN|nr:ATP-binding protein [Streptomyces sp. DSM 41636]MDT0398876.1 ATP-binding protein [Streptomyces sp. DSM 41636]
MKQSAAKTLGVAALGAAFAAAGAGAAGAAPALPDAAPALDTVTQAVPAEKVTTALPESENALATGQELASPAAPATGLLGGLPLQNLPTQGVTLNGAPLGA